MARTELNLQRITQNGLQISREAATTDGHQFHNDGKTAITVDNGSGSLITVTVQSDYSRSGLSLPDFTYDVPAGETHFFGPFDPDVFGDTTLIDFSATTSVNAGVVRVG